MSSAYDRENLRREVAEQERVLGGIAETVDDATVLERGVALWVLGQALLRLGEFEQSAARLDEAATALWSFEPDRRTAIIAREQQAAALAYLGRARDGLDLVDRLLNEAGLDWGDPTFLDLLPSVLGMRAKLLFDLERLDEADAAAEATLERIDSDGDRSQRLTAVEVLSVKARVAHARGQTSTVFELLDDVIKRCADEDSQEFEPRFAEALVMRAYALMEDRRLEEALAVNEQVLTRWGSDPNPEIKLSVAAARRSRKALRRAIFKLRLLRSDVVTGSRTRPR